MFLQLRILIVLEYWYQRNCAFGTRLGNQPMPRSRMFSEFLPLEQSLMYHHHIIEGHAL